MDLSITGANRPQVIYLPARPTEEFKSFFTPVLNFTDTHVYSSWIGPWSWGGTVRPVPGGGIPMHIPRVEVKFTFRDGGHSEFQSRFECLKERLHHAQEIGMSLSSSENLEPPPPYTPTASGPSPESGGPSNAQTGPQREQVQPQQEQPPQRTPDEPPPDYTQAQAQAITMQYEERTRAEAERS